MKLLVGILSVLFIQTVLAYDSHDEEDAKKAEHFELEKELQEAHDPEVVYKDANEKDVLEEYHVDADEYPVDADEEEEKESYADEEEMFNSMMLPPWMFPPPWMMYPPRPPPSEQYLRAMEPEEEMTEEDLMDLPVPFFPPFPYMPHMPNFEGPSDDEDEYPMPEFYPLPPFPFGLPDFLSGEHPLLPPPVPEEKGKGRQKRESLVETYDVHDPSEWWQDIDGGSANKVTQKLSRTKAGIASQQMMLDALDHYSPALHLGDIDTGYLRNPELERVGDRTFGSGSDFHLGDMDAFEFTPHGERLGSMWQLMDQVNSGKMTLGRRFYLHSLFFSNCQACYLSKSLMKVKDIKKITNSVDPFEKQLDEYWNDVNCGYLHPGVYVFLGIKQNYHGADGYYSDFVVFFQDQYGKQIAVVNGNANGMQEMSPFYAPTAFRGTWNKDKKTKMYLAGQPDVSYLYNSQYTNTGGRFGKDNLGRYYMNKDNQPGYDESAVYLENTWRKPLKGTANMHLAWRNVNPGTIGRPFQQRFNYINA